mmetsp:Transcript_33736/g.64539  ORF Transcript_33736/g.64539 Transcript_33736/m.64539 type:complete len:214 (+) Transcript_33736:1937-2578(+)
MRAVLAGRGVSGSWPLLGFCILSRRSTALSRATTAAIPGRRSLSVLQHCCISSTNSGSSPEGTAGRMRIISSAVLSRMSSTLNPSRTARPDASCHISMPMSNTSAALPRGPRWRSRVTSTRSGMPGNSKCAPIRHCAELNPSQPSIAAFTTAQRISLPSTATQTLCAARRRWQVPLRCRASTPLATWYAHLSRSEGFSFECASLSALRTSTRV